MNHTITSNISTVRGPPRSGVRHGAGSIHIAFSTDEKKEDHFFVAAIITISVIVNKITREYVFRHRTTLQYRVIVSVLFDK